MWRKIVQSTYRRNSRPKPLSERELARRFVEFLGMLAHMWADIERDLDDWVELVHMAGGAEQIQSHLPSNLDRELDYLKRAFKYGLIPTSTQEEGRRLMTEIHALKTFRHTLIHGVLMEIDSQERVVMDFWRVRGAVRTRIRTPFTRVQLERHRDRTRKLQLDLHAFVDAEYIA